MEFEIYIIANANSDHALIKLNVICNREAYIIISEEDS